MITDMITWFSHHLLLGTALYFLIGAIVLIGFLILVEEDCSELDAVHFGFWIAWMLWPVALFALTQFIPFLLVSLYFEWKKDHKKALNTELESDCLVSVKVVS